LLTLVKLFQPVKKEVKRDRKLRRFPGPLSSLLSTVEGLAMLSLESDDQSVSEPDPEEELSVEELSVRELSVSSS
jgi:hypothetical protein